MGREHGGRPPDESDGEAGASDANEFDPAEADISFGEFDDTPAVIMQVGELGVYMAYLAVALAVTGIALSVLQARILANMAFMLSFVLITLALLIGVVFQVYTGGIPIPGRKSG